MLSQPLSERWSAFRQLPHLIRPTGKTFGVCMDSGHETAALALYLKEEGASVLLLQDTTTIDEAVERAIEADCHLLLFGSPERVLELPAPEAVREPGLMQLSSGTTGPARVVGRSWSSIETECDAYNRALQQGKGLDQLTPVILAPVSHSYGLICGVISAQRRGLTARIEDSRNPKRMLAMLREHPEHLVYGVPILLHVLDAMAVGQPVFHTLMNSGAPLTPSLFERLQRSSQRVMQQYGCSELGCISLSTEAEDVQDVGMPLDTHHLSAGTSLSQPQEIMVYHRPSNRHIATGDLGYIQSGGKLHLMARTDDLINVSGRKVLPSAVEHVLLDIPGIAEAVVYRGRHPVMGERVHALVVGRERLTEQLIQAACRNRLPGYQVPAQIRLVERIPRLPSGKISRHRLAEEEQE